MPRKSASCLTANRPLRYTPPTFPGFWASERPSGALARSLPANDGPEAAECQKSSFSPPARETTRSTRRAPSSGGRRRADDPSSPADATNGAGGPGPGPRHVSEAAPPERRALPGQGGHPREGLRDLAVVHVAAVPRAIEAHRARPGGARVRPRGQDRARRGQPAPALLGDARHPGARRRAGAALPGLHREGDGVHRRPRGGPFRRRGGSGAGRQAPAGEGAVPAARVHRLRRRPGAARTTRTRA